MYASLQLSLFNLYLIQHIMNKICSYGGSLLCIYRNSCSDRTTENPGRFAARDEVASSDGRFSMQFEIIYI